MYLGHEDEISCLTLHPERDIVATGGTGAVPKLQIWSAKTMRPPEGVEGRFASGVASDGRFASSAGMPSPSLLARLDRIDVDTRISSSDAVRSVVGGGSSAIVP